MARACFFSFHFANDAWRASQVRNMGVVDGNKPVSDNDWEKVKKGGDAAIEKWIDDQMSGKSCSVVLVGSYRRILVTSEVRRQRLELAI
jgi:Thoeris protein ThsB, TIR-like domain